MITALVDWIWQGVALGVVVSLCLAGARQVSASMRYRIWWATLVVVLALPALGALELPGLGALVGGAVVTGPPTRPGLAASSVGVDAPPAWLDWLPLLAIGGWVSWSARGCHGALAHLDAAKRGCRPFPVKRERALSRWKAARNRGRRATLVVSEHVRAAAVLGLGYPRIAVRPDLVWSLTDEELDQLVLHEYAHVQRRDDVASAAQLIVKVLAGWHPAVWWIDRRLRIEREVACDDWVLATTGEARTYARCLTRIADLAAGSDSSLMPAATRQPQLTTRVMRLLDARRNRSTRPSFAPLASAALLLAALSVALAGNHTSVIMLPAVARASVAPAASTPELTLARLLQALAEPGTALRSASAARPARDAGPITPRDGASPHAVRAIARAEATLYLDGRSNAVRETVALVRYPAALDPVVAVASAGAPDRAPEAPLNAADTAPAARSGTAVDLASADSWVATTRRALADAGKATGQSLAEAGVSTGQAVAGAGLAAARSTQRSAVKVGRFFSRLGRKLAAPF